MECVSRQLSSELRNKYRILNSIENDNFYFQCEKNQMKRIIEDAEYESYKIENPNVYNEFPSVSRSTRKKTTRNGIKSINNARLWGIKNFNPKNFEESFVREIAGMISPEIYDNSIAKYRTVSARLNGKNGCKVMPNYEKISNYEIPSFVCSLNKQFSKIENANPIDPVDVIIASAFAHFQIARIHPFVDGNGRTARTLQNIILNHYKIPMPIIKSGERFDYYTHLENAVDGYNNNRAQDNTGLSKGEQEFYEFMAGKINSSFDTILDKCYK